MDPVGVVPAGLFCAPGMARCLWSVSLLRAVVNGTASRRQLLHCEVWWEGSRRQRSDSTNRNRIQGRRRRVRQQWMPTPDIHPEATKVNPARPDGKRRVLPREVCRTVRKDYGDGDVIG
jgi:hypothetical protein